MNTLEEILNYLSLIQKKRAKKSQGLYKAMRTPTVDNLKTMIQMNITKNKVLAADNVNLTTNAYGPDVEWIKDKSKRSRPKPFVSNIVEIPDEFM